MEWNKSHEPPPVGIDQVERAVYDKFVSSAEVSSSSMRPDVSSHEQSLFSVIILHSILLL